jgi:hypothetical protein
MTKARRRLLQAAALQCCCFAGSGRGPRVPSTSDPTLPPFPFEPCNLCPDIPGPLQFTFTHGCPNLSPATRTLTLTRSGPDRWLFQDFAGMTYQGNIVVFLVTTATILVTCAFDESRQRWGYLLELAIFGFPGNVPLYDFRGFADAQLCTPRFMHWAGTSNIIPIGDDTRHCSEKPFEGVATL